MTLLRLPATCLAIISLAHTAAAGLIHDQGDVDEDSTLLDSISWQVIANDFTLTETTTLEAFRLWVVDPGSIDDRFRRFSGTIGWAIYDSDSRTAGPGHLLAYGQDANVQVTPTMQVLNGDTLVFQLDGVFNSPTSGSVSDLAAGNYWLAIHEGDWLSPYDGRSISWVWASTQHGNTAVFAENPISPSFSKAGAIGTFDHAFQLYGTAAATSVPEPSTLVLSALGALGLTGVRRRRVPDTCPASTNRRTPPA